MICLFIVNGYKHLIIYIEERIIPGQSEGERPSVSKTKQPLQLLPNVHVTTTSSSVHHALQLSIWDQYENVGGESVGGGGRVSSG